MRAVVLLQPDHLLDPELALEVTHVADFCTAEGVDRLVIVAHCKELRPIVSAVVGQQLQPLVLQHVGILELVDQDVAEALLVMDPQRFVAVEQFVGTQQQFSEVDHPLALALCLVFGVQLDAAPGVVIENFGLGSADALLLVRIDEMAQLARRKLLVVDVEVLEQTFDCRLLVARIEDLEQRRQPGFLVMRPQQPVAQAVEGADPHRPDIHRQHRRQPRLHLLGRLVGEGHRQDARGRHLSGRQQPGDPRSKHSRLSAACPSKNKGRLRRQGNGSKLLRVQVGKQI